MMDVDLRVQPVAAVLQRAARHLAAKLDTTTVVRKRRTLGARTSRGTWVRIEQRPLERIGRQGWNGIEAAAVLGGVAMPRWLAGCAWRGPDGAAMWRADETDVITDQPVKTGATLVVDPGLPASWWSALNESLDALAGAHTTRQATPNGLPITQDRVTGTIRAVFPEVVDTTIAE